VIFEARTIFMERAQGPLIWGFNDCALVIADALLPIIGHDLAAPYRGAYSSAEEFHVLTGVTYPRFVERLCMARGWSLIGATEKHGVAVGLARVLGLAPACVIGFDRTWVGKGGEGVAMLNPSDVRLAWRVI